MADWKAPVRARLSSLHLTPAAESELADELAEHLEDYHRELLRGGATEEEAYRNTIAELDDMYPIRASVDKSQRTPKQEAVPIGDARPGTYCEASSAHTRLIRAFRRRISRSSS